MQIGKKIKGLRKTKKMTLTDLSEKSGVQIATLSRIENLKMTGTLESHVNIAKALGLDLPQLYQDVTTAQGEASPVIEGPMETFSYNSTASYEILTSKVMSKKMMPIILRIEPGGKTNPEQNPAGSEKFIFVLEGEIILRIADKSYPLPAHHTLYFDAGVKHYFTNPGKKAAKVISVTTPMAL